MNDELLLAVAVFLASTIGVGILLFWQDLGLALFVSIVLLILVSKYYAIKSYFTKIMMRLFNIE